MFKKIFTLTFLLCSTVFGAVYAENVPVVFIHRGDSDYLVHSLEQALKHNDRVILIGDRSNEGYAGVEHHSYKSYFSSANEFEKLYKNKHKSSNAYDYELFCFQRWYILKEFMQAQGLSAVFYADSDVMLYCDVTDEYDLFSEYDLSMIRMEKSCSGHSSFFTLGSLSEACQFITRFYRSFSTYSQRYSHISDMQVFEAFRQSRNKANIPMGQLQDIADGGRFDVNIGLSEGAYEMEGGVKKIVWVSGQPYCYHAGYDRKVRFKSLHFQGNKKSLMQKFKEKKTTEEVMSQ